MSAFGIGAALAQHGIGESAVSVETLQMDLSTGKLAKAMRATYRLRVDCRPAAQIAAALGCVAGQKTIELTAVTWRFDDAPSLRDELLRACLTEVSAPPWRARADV